MRPRARRRPSITPGGLPAGARAPSRRGSGQVPVEADAAVAADEDGRRGASAWLRADADAVAHAGPRRRRALADRRCEIPPVTLARPSEQPVTRDRPLRVAGVLGDVSSAAGARPSDVSYARTLLEAATRPAEADAAHRIDVELVDAKPNTHAHDAEAVRHDRHRHAMAHGRQDDRAGNATRRRRRRDV